MDKKKKGETNKITGKLKAKYDFLLANSLFKVEECCYRDCLAMVCSSYKEYKTKHCKAIFTCVNCDKTFCDKHIKIEQIDKYHYFQGMCRTCFEKIPELRF